MKWEPGPKNLITDVPGILVGNSDDCVLKSGVSVLTSLNPNEKFVTLTRLEIS